MKTINGYLNNEYQKAFKEYFENLLDVFDSLNTLHWKRKIQMTFKTINGTHHIPFRGKIFYIKMPISNGTDKISHSQLQEILLNIQTLKQIKADITDYKKELKGIHPQTVLNLP